MELAPPWTHMCSCAHLSLTPSLSPPFSRHIWITSESQLLEVILSSVLIQNKFKLVWHLFSIFLFHFFLFVLLFILLYIYTVLYCTERDCICTLLKCAVLYCIALDYCNSDGFAHERIWNFSGVNLVWNLGGRGSGSTTFRFFQANFSKTSIFSGNFKKDFDFPGKNCWITAISGQIILFHSVVKSTE